MKPNDLLLFLVLSFCIGSCYHESQIPGGEGWLKVNGGTIWYKVTGNEGKTPLILLHGGPGYPSYNLNPMLKLSDERPVIIFDQLGCGRSGRITDTSLMTLDNYVAQVHQLVKKLGLKNYYLLGHSWGTMLGVDYYFEHPEGIRGMILGSPCLSAAKWVSDADTLLSKLPDSTEVTLRNSMKGISQDSLKLKQAMEVFFNHYYNRKLPLSADLDSMNAGVGWTVYEYMWGKSEFYATGTLKNYDRTAVLKNIKVPVLFTTGEYDAATPATVKYYQSLTPDAKFALIKNAGHYTMQDNEADNLKLARDFLRALDKSQ